MVLIIPVRLALVFLYFDHVILRNKEVKLVPQRALVGPEPTQSSGEAEVLVSGTGAKGIPRSSTSLVLSAEA